MRKWVLMEGGVMALSMGGGVRSRMFSLSQRCLPNRRFGYIWRNHSGISIMLEFIKEATISWGNRWAARNSRTTRRSVSFREAKKIGVLVNLSDPGERGMLNEAIRVFKKYQKDVIVLGFYAEPPQEEETRFLTYQIHDFGLVGQVKSKQVERFIGMDFDFLYCLTRSQHPAIERVLISSHAKCRIGPRLENNEPLFEMMIQLEKGQNMNELFNRMMHYTHGIC